MSQPVVRVLNDNSPFVRHLCTTLACVFLLSGCANQRFVELREQPRNPLAEQLSLYTKRGPKPSDRTLRLLHRYALPTDIEENARDVIYSLAHRHEQEPTAESAYALAELCYTTAARAKDRKDESAWDYYAGAVFNAYAYLFDARLAITRNPYDPQFRGACDVYNTALEECLRAAKTKGRLHPGSEFAIKSCGRTIKVNVVAKGFDWRDNEFDEFQFVSDFELKGLTNEHRTQGLGVPLIATRREASHPPQFEKYYAKRISFPVTAFLRLLPADKAEPDVVTAELELYDPLEVIDVQVAGRWVPLESDISTPLAYFLDNPDLQKLDTYGLLRPDKARQIAGLYMLQPYQPGKIPVVMVHGLWSSPMTWMEALNDLRSDPVLRQNYQFCFYLYPTGEPFWKSAADLREDLSEVRRVFSPHDPDHQFDQTVVIGHSMGGLISRLITYESGNEFWNTVSEKPLRQVNATDEVKRELERIYYFKKHDTVRRVITIGSPHRGSEYANSFVRWLAKRVIWLPRMTLQTTQQLLSMNPQVFHDGGPFGAETSLDSLSPQSPILQAMHRRPLPKDISYHNVVGITKTNVPLEKNTDGVVAYASAHRDDVETELVVHAEHSDIHRHPETILELRRILRQHLKDVSRERSPILLLNHQK